MLIGLLVSGLAFVVASLAYERLALQHRLGVDDDVTWLALAAGPALIIVIHRVLHKAQWIALTTLVIGAVLTGVGALQFAHARAAMSRHVSAGPFSGIEHSFTVALALGVLLAGVLAVLAALLSLLARRLDPTSASRKGVSQRPAP